MDASKPDMTYTTLGATGLEVSELCLGCMNFGSEAEWMMNDREASVDLIHEALDHGINFLDTADVYSRGESEEIVGEAVASANRDELVLATKVYGDMHEGPNGQGLSRKHVLDQVEDSLDRLGTDYVDLYRIHRWDESTPVEETLSALDHLVETGRVRYIGASTMSGYRFTKALYESDLNDYERFTCMQPEYNAVDRHEEANLLPMCAGEGVGVIRGRRWPAASSRGGTSATPSPTRTPAPPATTTPDSGSPTENWAVLDEIRAVADDRDATPAQVSLAWLLHEDVVDAPIVGPRSRAQSAESVRAVGVELTDEEVARIEAPITPRWPAPAKD